MPRESRSWRLCARRNDDGVLCREMPVSPETALLYCVADANPHRHDASMVTRVGTRPPVSVEAQENEWSTTEQALQ
jgi:hypothetical protein